MKRGVILYDFLLCRGGAEQVSIDLARGIPGTDICVAFRNREVFTDDEFGGIPCRELNRIWREDIALWRTWSGLRAFSKDHPFLKVYDWALFSGSNAPVAVRNRPGRNNYYYCHTIPRFCYDLKEYYLDSLPGWKRPLFNMFSNYVRNHFEQAMQGMDKVVANSRNVQDRLSHHLGIDSEVVYPPCNITAYSWQGQGNYYLSTARLQRYKRVDLIIEAFLRMPDRKLVVASGGSDEKRLKRIAGSASNIFFTGWQTPPQLRELMGNCIATVYVSKDEDFGMSPVESMAAGKPVIGVAEGGLLETVVPGETGTLLSPDPKPEDIVAAVHELKPQQATEMRRECEARSTLFSRERFLDKMRGILQ